MDERLDDAQSLKRWLTSMRVSPACCLDRVQDALERVARRHAEPGLADEVGRRHVDRAARRWSAGMPMSSGSVSRAARAGRGRPGSSPGMVWASTMS